MSVAAVHGAGASERRGERLEAGHVFCGGGYLRDAAPDRPIRVSRSLRVMPEENRIMKDPVVEARMKVVGCTRVLFTLWPRVWSHHKWLGYLGACVINALSNMVLYT